MIRASADRWARVQVLCKQLRRVVQASAQIDMLPTRANWKERLDAASDVSDQVDAIAAAVDDEIGRVTCELLQGELARRQRKDSR